MKLSIVIPTRSRYPNLVHVIEALTDQTLDKSEYEVIISDDNSTDETQSVVNQFKDRLNLKYIFSNIPKPHTWNASVVRNLGALCADHSSSHLLFVDSDVVLPSHALQTYVEDIALYPDQVIIGPYDFYKQGNEQIAQADVRNPEFEKREVKETSQRATDGLAMFGGNLIIPKKLFWKVGGFDEDIHIGLEDGSMGLKCWKADAKFSYESRCRGKHQWHETPADRFPPNMHEHIQNLNRKHFGNPDPDWGIVEASKEAYKQWDIDNWQEPPEWKANKLDFMMGEMKK